jgi:protein involved in polysaccharide export with SLBB domain
MVKFKQKNFSKKLEVVKKAGKYLIDHPILPVSTTALGINIANYRTNKRRTEEGKEYQEAQLQAMKDLNENITRNNEALLIVKDALGENSKRLSERRDEEYKPISKKRKKNI